MNLRNWGKQHTIGLFIGLATTIICCFIVIGILSWKDGIPYSLMFERFTFLNVVTAKVISLASIGNLIWFHIFLRREKWPIAMGVIMATVLNLFIILYYKFF